MAILDKSVKSFSMQVFKTESLLRNFIIIQSFFCINRSYLIENKKIRIFCNVIVALVITLKTCAFFFDFFLSETEVSTNIRVFQFLSSLQLAYLAKFAKHEKCFKKIEELDEMFVFDEQFSLNFQRAVSKAIFADVASVILYIFAFPLEIFAPTVTFTFFIASAANKSECSMYNLLMKSINLRLANLNKVPHNLSSKVYAHIFIATTYMSEGFTTEIPIIVMATYFKIIIYMVYTILFNTMTNTQHVYFICLNFVSAYFIYILCSESAQTELILKKIMSRLAKKLVFDPKINKDPKSSQYQYVYRWYSCLKADRPSFHSSRLMSLNLAVPLQLIDICINYVLIIVQIYIAFFLD